MKKVVWLGVILSLLCGCSSQNNALDAAMEFRSRLLAAQSCRFSAEVTADYGDKLHEFSMDCQADPHGNLTFSVTGPDTIAGIGGTIADAGGSLTFEDTALYFDLLADDQLSPVSAPWILVKTLRSGYLTSACMEEDLLHLTIDDSFREDALQLDIWLRQSSPIRADILYDGRRILTVDVKDFEIL